MGGGWFDTCGFSGRLPGFSGAEFARRSSSGFGVQGKTSEVLALAEEVMYHWLVVVVVHLICTSGVGGREKKKRNTAI